MRIRMITRTVVENKVTVKAYNIKNDAIESIVFSVIGDYTVKEVEKLSREMTEDNNEKTVEVYLYN